jgi:hypothetical protein
MSRQKEIEAANALEDLVPELKEIIKDLRDGTTQQPYALVYHFRTSIGRIVAMLGTGHPGPVREHRYVGPWPDQPGPRTDR